MREEVSIKDLPKGVPQLVDLESSIEKSKSLELIPPSTILEWQNPSQRLLNTARLSNIDKVEALASPSNMPWVDGLFRENRIKKVIEDEWLPFVKKSRLDDEKKPLQYIMIYIGARSYAQLKLHLNPTRLSNIKLFGGKGEQKALDGNNNIFDDEESYSRTGEVWEQFFQCLDLLEQKGHRVFSKIYQYKIKAKKEKLKLRTKFGHIEFYVMVRSVNWPQELEYFKKLLTSLFGSVEVELDANGNIIGPIYYYFNCEELSGAFLKIYRKTNTLIRIEITFGHAFFKNRNKSNFKTLSLKEVSNCLRIKSYQLFEKILITQKDFNNEITYEQCIEEVASITGHYFDRIVQSLKVNAGIIVISSKEKGYRQVLKLVKAGILQKCKSQSTFEITPKYLPLISRDNRNKVFPLAETSVDDALMESAFNSIEYLEYQKSIIVQEIQFKNGMQCNQ